MTISKYVACTYVRICICFINADPFFVPFLFCFYSLNIEISFPLSIILFHITSTTSACKHYQFIANMQKSFVLSINTITISQSFVALSWRIHWSALSNYYSSRNIHCIIARNMRINWVFCLVLVNRFTALVAAAAAQTAREIRSTLHFKSTQNNLLYLANVFIKH